MEGPSAIELRQLGKDYGTKQALRGVSLSVGWGEVFGYVGANGAGKTTTIKILTGLIRPSSGDALVGGHSVLEQPLEVKARLGYVPESGALFEKFSPVEYLTLIGRLYRLSEAQIRERMGTELRSFGLEADKDKPMGVLSKGTKQKVCWISALLHDPEVLVLDEPLNGLDVETVAYVKEMMRRRAQEGRTIFYSSHLIDIVEKVCTRIAVIHAGQIVSVGTVGEVVAASGSSSLEHALLALSARAAPA
ncbi:MAG TPA: ABC transporter ATP-binding protein [Vicinamibacteria bacterium]|nr:ABC transporter ATP-binding protein [Vicinamibacteria bacterium]